MPIPVKTTRTVKLNTRAVKAMAAEAKPYIAFDSDIRGFGVRVMPSGMKTFIFEYRPHGGGRSVAKRRLKLGRLGGNQTVEHARKKAEHARARVELGADPAAEKADQRAAITVGGLIDAFIAQHVDTKCKEDTKEAHKAALERLRAAHGALKAESLTRAQVTAMHTKMRAHPFAANRFLAVISKAFNWAAEQEIVMGTPNPATQITRYKEAGRARYLSTDELGRLGDVMREAETVGLQWEVDETRAGAKHAPKPSNRRRKLDSHGIAALRLLILTGARLREILDARWEHVDFERGIIHLPDSKTGAKPIYLSKVALGILSALQRIEGNPHVIPGGKEGAPRADLKKPWAAVTRAAGLPKVRIHDLRHSFASVGASASMGLPIIGRLLGHSQPSTTARYTHLDADPMHRAVETISGTISAAMDRADKAENAAKVAPPAERRA